MLSLCLLDSVRTPVLAPFAPPLSLIITLPAQPPLNQPTPTNHPLRCWRAPRAVDAAYKMLLHHGGWRAHVLRLGYIPEADIARPLAANSIFLPGCDREGRALIIVKVANHDARRRDLREMKLFSTYVMEALVGAPPHLPTCTCSLRPIFPCLLSFSSFCCLLSVLRDEANAPSPHTPS